MARQKARTAGEGSVRSGGPERFVLEKTYTSYAVAIPHEDNEALGADGRRAVKDRLNALVPEADYFEFDWSEPSAAYLYLRFHVDDDTPENRAIVQSVLDEEITKALEASPGTRMR